MSLENPYINIPPHELTKLNRIFRKSIKCPGGRIFFTDQKSYEESVKSVGADIEFRVKCPGNCGGNVSFTIAGTID